MNNRSAFPFLLIAIITGLARQASCQVSEYGISTSPATERKTDVRTIAQAENAVAVYVDPSAPNGPGTSRQEIFRSLAPEPYSPKENYVMTVELARLSWPLFSDQNSDRLGGRLAVGFNRPSYNIKNELRVIGSFDIKIDGIIVGLQNSARVTFKYDFSRPIKSPKTRFDMVCDNIVLKVGIPFTIR